MKEKNKVTLWLALFAVLPASLLWPLSEYFAEPGITRTLISGLFGGLGFVVGLGLYYWTKNKSKKTKIIGLVAILIIGVTTIRTVHLSSKKDFDTCEICGYKAIDKQEGECNVCASNIWEKEKSRTLYDSKSEWLAEEQLFWFAEDDTAFVQYYEPNEIDGFQKDEEWKPSINKTEILEYNKD